MNDDGLEKLLFEIQLVQNYWPQFSWIFDGNRWLVHGTVGGDGNLSKTYEVCVDIPSNYHLGGLPQVYILNENLPEGTPHVYNRAESRICSLHQQEYYKKNTMLHQIIGWTYAWLVAYENWKNNHTYGWSN